MSARGDYARDTLWAQVMIGPDVLADTCPLCSGLVLPGEGTSTDNGQPRSNRDHHIEWHEKVEAQ